MCNAPACETIQLYSDWFDAALTANKAANVKLIKLNVKLNDKRSRQLHFINSQF